MKKNYFLALSLFVCLVVTAFAQEIPYQYGIIPLEYVNLKHYEKDTTAHALILYEQGSATITRDRFDDIRLFYTYKARVKIFRKEAFNKATYKIPLAKSIHSKKKEKLVYAKAIAVNADQAPAHLNESDIYIEDHSTYLDYAKFTIPNTTEGTVFDVEYQTVSPYMYNFQEWEFQGDIPKLHSEYHTSIPANYKYHVKLVGSLALDSHTGALKKNCLTSARGGKADCEINHYVMKNIPAFVGEAYMTTADNYCSKIAFELKEVQGFDGLKYNYTKSWKDVDKELKYKENIGIQARKTKSFKKHIPENIYDMPQKLDKAKAIYNDLQKRMAWNNTYAIFGDVDVKKAFEERSGSVAELNLIVLNMLNAAGFNANFMLLSTRSNGIATRLYPVISEFNYLVVKLDLDEKTYLLDITDKNIPFGMLPFRALNGYGRVIDTKNESYWYDIKASKNSLNTNYIEHRISAEGNLTTRIIETNSGYFAIDKRAKLAKTSQETYLNHLEDKLSTHMEATISNYEISNKNNTEKSLRETFTINFQENLAEDLIYLYPFTHNIYRKNPFKLDVRNYPVNFGYPFGYHYQITIKTDPSYEILEIPEEKNLIIDENYAMLRLKSHTNTPHELSISLTFTINSSLFISDKYQDLKKIYSTLVAIQNKLPVVLRKKKAE